MDERKNRKKISTCDRKKPPLSLQLFIAGIRDFLNLFTNKLLLLNELGSLQEIACGIPHQDHVIARG
jgi:hypothetical protein